jgi:hypothetical protein
MILSWWEEEVLELESAEFAAEDVGEKRKAE